MKNWYVVQTKPKEEERAAFFLRNRNIELYLPKMEVCTMKQGKKNLTEKPLFPSYLFARFGIEDDLCGVRWTKGVRKILPESIHPVPVQEAVIESIMRFAGKDNIIRKRNLKRNDRIRIVKGPMKDLLGIFENWSSDQGRVKVLLDLLNYQARVELHYSLIEKVA
ncbi:MAG: transcription termination/antitermination NusG family protein [Thermodesulfobacteriota bacterium]|nr:transcription termination/antitermination NusG family protein [Thermodesulfobacteriota bacterium]